MPDGSPSLVDAATGSPPPRTRFDLRASAFCPLAQRAMVALAAHGTSWTHDVVPEDQEPATLRLIEDEDVIGQATGSLAMLDLIEAAHARRSTEPAGPSLDASLRVLMEVGVAAQDHLSAVTRATESNDLNIAVHGLRLQLAQATVLIRIDGRLADHRFDLADVVFGPTLWRARVLDDHCETYLLSGFDDLAAWERRLSSHPAMRAVFDGHAKSRYLAILRARDAVLLPEADAAAWRILLGHDRALHGAG